GSRGRHRVSRALRNAGASHDDTDQPPDSAPERGRRSGRIPTALSRDPPLPRTLGGGARAAAAPSPPALRAENALLTQQRFARQRPLKRPARPPADRARRALLARLTPTGPSALLIVQPPTLLRWPRQGYRLFWRARSATARQRPQIASPTAALIQQMARENG